MTVAPEPAGGAPPPGKPAAGKGGAQPAPARGGPVAVASRGRGGEGGAAAAAVEEGGKKKGSKKKLLIVLAVVLLLGGGFYVVKGRSHKVVYKSGQPVPPGKVTSLGTLTVNTSDGHIVQVGIDLQLTQPANPKTVSADRPQLRNAAIIDLGEQTYPGLLAPRGRTALQHTLTASFQKVLGPVDGAAPQVSAVYFTSFILQ